MTPQFDVIIVGGGMVGAAIGYGLAGGKRRILMLDGADTDYRAAKANFGLVWAHGKGMRDPDYQRLSLNAAKTWPAFASQLEEESGISLDYEQKGGLNFCLSDDEFEARAKAMDAWNRQTPELAPSAHMLDRAELLRRFPTMKLGKAVVGASFGEFDGHANPLRLLAAMHKAFMGRGGQLQSNRPVTHIRRLSGGGFEVHAGDYKAQCERIVVAAGLGCAALGPMVGLNVPIRPQRGQLLVTERLAPLLPIPASGLRQTAEGTVMIGVTQEEVGFDLATTTEGAARITRKALKILPELAQAKLVRQWSCLRIMTPDGNPVYARSLTHPGAEIATCHSGVTLASFHANEYAKVFDAKSIPADLEIFHYGRFDLQKTS